MSNGDALPRAVVDANLVVSGVVIERGAPLALVEAWHRQEFRWLISESFLDDYIEVLHRPRLLQEFSTPIAEIDQFLELVTAYAEHIQPLVSLLLEVRDPKDEKLLAAALGGNADYLVTGDRDLLVLADDPRLGNLRIVTVAEFLAELEASADNRRREAEGG